MKSAIKAFAFYLPQFHPVKENDEWWGKGFTEWTNVGKAKSYFPNHYQPRVPKDLGYYDLRVPETRESQAALAEKYSIDGFCYWHYWFGNGRRLLEKPFNEVIRSGKPDFPFLLGWANESWKGFPHGLKDRNTLIEQLYPGREDFENHFYSLIDAFKDKRYVRIDGKLAFLIYKPLANIKIKEFISVWRKLAKSNGLEDFYFIGHINEFSIDINEVYAFGFDVVNTVRLNDFSLHLNSFKYRFKKFCERKLYNAPRNYEFSEVMKYFINKEVDSNEGVFPSIITGWDHTPRSGRDGLVLNNFNPKIFREYLEKIFSLICEKKTPVVFIKSWNEWAEGNYLEPDLKYGNEFLEVFRDVKESYKVC